MSPSFQKMSQQKERSAKSVKTRMTLHSAQPGAGRRSSKAQGLPSEFGRRRSGRSAHETQIQAPARNPVVNESHAVTGPTPRAPPRPPRRRKRGDLRQQLSSRKTAIEITAKRRKSRKKRIIQPIRWVRSPLPGSLCKRRCGRPRFAKRSFGGTGIPNLEIGNESPKRDFGLSSMQTFSPQNLRKSARSADHSSFPSCLADLAFLARPFRFGSAALWVSRFMVCAAQYDAEYETDESAFPARSSVADQPGLGLLPLPLAPGPGRL